jgi:hypothetical protein
VQFQLQRPDRLQLFSERSASLGPHKLFKADRNDIGETICSR